MDQHQIFQDLHLYIQQCAQTNECILVNWNGESSTFARFNHSKVRQFGQVEQIYAHIDLINGHRHCTMQCTLGADNNSNQNSIQAALTELRQQIEFCPEDPFLHYNTDIFNSSVKQDSKLPHNNDGLSSIFEKGADLDFVGIWASGDIYRGFSSSLGQCNWHQQQNFHCDWSIYHQTDKAVKCSHAGTHWDKVLFEQDIDAGISQLEIMKRPSKTIDPGTYRCYLAPSAVAEITNIISWRGFGCKQQETQQSCLQLLVNGERTLHRDLHLSEDYVNGLGPTFTSEGFKLPDQVTLIKNGTFHSALTCARSAKEYNKSVNALHESLGNASMQAGSLAEKDIVKQLDTGIYINNLWYLNYTDPMAGKITGMTRFACFWVENGEIQAPINVMRFDDSIFNLLGEHLEAITDFTRFMPSASTYHQRSCNSSRLPGLLVDEMIFTL